jgi:hypothetical protein
MTERDEELERGVALAKSALSAPTAVRARVRAKLAEAALAASAASATGATGVAPPVNGSRFARVARSPSHAVGWAVAWVGLGLCAGYWLGFHRIGAARVDPAPVDRVVDSAVGDAAGSAPSPPLRAPSSAGAVAAGPGENPGPTAGGDGDGDDAAKTPGAVAAETPGAVAAETPGAVAAVRALGGEQAREARRRSSAARRAPLVGSTGSAAKSSSEPTSAFAAEVALLERAERAIRAGEGARALALLEELEQKFPASTLREERAAARVLAGCEQAGSNGAAAREAARVAAERFLAQGSALYADRVRQLCELGAGSARSSIEDPTGPGH